MLCYVTDDNIGTNQSEVNEVDSESELQKSSQSIIPKGKNGEEKDNSTGPSNIAPLRVCKATNGKRLLSLNRETNVEVMKKPPQPSPSTSTPKKSETSGLTAFFNVPKLSGSMGPPKQRKRPQDISTSSDASEFATPPMFKKIKQSPKDTTVKEDKDVDEKLLDINEKICIAVQSMDPNSHRIAVASEAVAEYIHAGTEYWKWISEHIKKDFTSNLRMEEGENEKKNTAEVNDVEPDNAVDTESTERIKTCTLYTIISAMSLHVY